MKKVLSVILLALLVFAGTDVLAQGKSKIKFSNGMYTITKDYDLKLRQKVEVFMSETKIKKNPHLTLITTYGLTQNEYSGHIQKCITMDSLFEG